MILAIDVGNTHIQIGLYQDSRFLTDWRITTGVNRTEDELMGIIYQFLSLKHYTLRDVQDVALSSVVPDITQILTLMSRKYFGLQPVIVDHTLETGIRIDYDPPSSVGADRICNAVAAYEKYGGPDVVVDLGTATTLDVITADGVYLGGVIAPGVETTAWSLHARASKLPRISLDFPPSAIGKTTEHSMQSGILLGAVKMIDGLIEAIQTELEGKPNVIATGGLAGLLAPRSKYIQHIEPTLVLDGLIHIYLKNRLNKNKARS